MLLITVNYNFKVSLTPRWQGRLQNEAGNMDIENFDELVILENGFNKHPRK